MANRPACSDDADTTRRLNALEDLVTTLSQSLANAEQDIADLDQRVTSLENAN